MGPAPSARTGGTTGGGGRSARDRAGRTRPRGSARIRKSGSPACRRAVKREYLDASAFIKLILPEPESHALREWLRGRTWVSSMLLHAEALRSARRHGTPAVDAAMRMLRRTEFIRLGRAPLDHSAVVGAPGGRTADAR